MFNTICGIVFLVSVVYKLHEVVKSYDKDDEFMNGYEEDKDE